jgi:hypothetical protein
MYIHICILNVKRCFSQNELNHSIREMEKPAIIIDTLNKHKTKGPAHKEYEFTYRSAP